jgi:hypothetical protein
LVSGPLLLPDALGCSILGSSGANGPPLPPETIMGTRSRIGYQLPDLSIVSTYCHYDGYLEGNGRILAEHYQDREAVKELIDGGSMSSLRVATTWESSAVRDDSGNIVRDADDNWVYSNTREPQPLYHSERGDGEDPTHTNFEEFTSGNSGEEFAYLYTTDGKWRAYKIGWGDTNTEEITMPELVTA